MINQMQHDIKNIKNQKLDTSFSNTIIAVMVAWLIPLAVNFIRRNSISTYICSLAVVINLISITVTVYIFKKDKYIFLLYKGFYSLSMSVGFLFLANNIYYIVMMTDSIYFPVITIVLFLCVFMGMTKLTLNKLKKSKIDNEKSFISNKTLISGSSLVFIAYLFSNIVIQKSSQSVIGLLSLSCFVLLSFLLAGASPYYFIEYLVAKKKIIK